MKNFSIWLESQQDPVLSKYIEDLTVKFVWHYNIHAFRDLWGVMHSHSEEKMLFWKIFAKVKREVEKYWSGISDSRFNIQLALQQDQHQQNKLSPQEIQMLQQNDKDLDQQDWDSRMSLRRILFLIANQGKAETESREPALPEDMKPSKSPE